MEIKDDGTQTFTCKIPKFYLSEEPNSRIINPRWKDIENGILAENTRVLKISIQFSEEQTKVFPFIIDKIVNKRDKNFAVYKEITCNGLAFAELGKQGYKVELNAFTLEQDFAKDDSTLATIDYWLDKIFPNEKDENGYITKWLTPWCYEIRMDWRGYLEELSKTFINGGMAGQIEGYSFYDGKTSIYDEETIEKWIQIDAGTSGPLYQPRDETVIYENPYVADWDVVNNKLSPVSVVSFKEKARYIDCSNSNKYNITQSIAEAFEVFCIYEYTCEPNGHFKKTYFDEAGNIWTGKKVIFFNRAIKSDNPYVINYQHNLNTISRIVDSSELYTKMYVNPIASETMDTGYVSIADTSLNPLLDDFILNFDYLYKIGSINDIQKAEIESYEIKTHLLNKQIIEVENEGAELAEQLNEKEAAKASAEASLKSAQEQLMIYETNMISLETEPVLKDKNAQYMVQFIAEKNMDILKGNLRLEGINITSIVGYSDNSYTDAKKLFTGGQLVYAQNMPSDASNNIDTWYVTKDNAGFPQYIFTSLQNPILKNKDKFGSNFNAETGAAIYFSFEYFPLNKYESICASLRAKINIYESKIDEYIKEIGTDEGEATEWSGLKGQLKVNEETRLALYNEKDTLNFRLERILGPALREGYWQPETYEDPGEGHNVVLTKDRRQDIIDNTSIIFDNNYFEGEQKEYYYASSDDLDKNIKTYYPYIDLTKIYEYIGTTKKKNSEEYYLVSDFCLTLLSPEYSFTTVTDNRIIGNSDYYVLLDGKYYTFKVPEGNYPAGTVLTIHTDVKPFVLTIDEKIIDSFVQDDTFKPVSSTYINLTGAFMGANQYLSSIDLYNETGFVYAFLKFGENDIRPVALLIGEDIDYTRYSIIQYSFNRGQDKNSIIIEEDGTTSTLSISTRQDKDNYVLVYPRIFIDYRNVNVTSDNFMVYVTSNAIKLTKYEDYSILTRKARSYITLKVSDRQYPFYILNESYNIIYQISRANEQLYLDAKQVAKDSSKPKYSYEIQVANIPDEINYLELGQLCHINDYTVDVYKEYGYISELKYQLDKPSQDSVVISNYKTKFEDLFSSISAQNEAMKQNQNIYNIAAASFTSKGEVRPEVLQTTLDNNNFIFNFTESNLSLDAKGGLVLTNTEPYENGVFGQMALYGSGIMCSREINDITKERIWDTAITAKGINAKTITVGTLDTSLIRIMSGTQAAFQWNPEGLYAYKTKVINGQTQYMGNSFVRLNELGLHYMIDGVTELELGWEGLKIESAKGHVKLTGKHGLQMFGSDSKKPLVTFGNYITYNDEEQTSIKKDYGYGMFFTNTDGNIQLQANHDGNLQLIDTLRIGSSDDTNYAGLCGNDKVENKDPITEEQIRIWAGSETPASAEFTVGENGAVKARRIFIQNSDGSKTLELTYDKLEKLLALI